MSAPVIEINHLTKSYRQWGRKPVMALNDISLQSTPGTSIGLLGPNGAGKSTLLKILAGLCHPDSGGVRVGGERAGSSTARQLIGFLPENPGFYGHLTARETLILQGKLSGFPGEELVGRVDSLLSRVGLDNASSERRVEGFSKGMRQRLGLAQAMLTEPRILLLDEPFSGLDPAGVSEFESIFSNLRENGVTLMISSHLLATVEMICDRALFMLKGSVVSDICLRSEGSASVELSFAMDSISDAHRAAIETALRSVGIHEYRWKRSSGHLEQVYLETFSRSPGPAGPESK